MAAVANLVHETSTDTGTGNFTLILENGKQRFSTAFGTGVTPNVFEYFISNRGAPEWERGTGHMSGTNTLVRDTVLESSNANSPVNFSAGTKDVTNDIPAASQVRRDASNTWTANQQFVDNTGFADDSGNEQLIFHKTAAAVNQWGMTNAATGGKPILAPEGGDTNIIGRINGKGTGGVELEGTATNDSASAGYVGEYVESVIAKGSGVALTSGVVADITSIPLTAGDWDITIQSYFNPTNASTSVVSAFAFLATVSLGSSATAGQYAGYRTAAFVPGNGNEISLATIGPYRVSLNATTTYFFTMLGGFTVSTAAGFGIIRARRVR